MRFSFFPQPVRLHKTALLFFAFTMGGLSQRGNATALAKAPTIPQRPSLVGTITDKAGVPIKGATVYIATAKPRVGSSPYCPSCYLDCGKKQNTDAHGSFRITSLDPTLIFRILVVRDGYAPIYVPKVDPIKDKLKVALVSVPPEVGRKHLISGRVLGPVGEPVVGATVEPVGLQYLDHTLFGTADGIEPLAITDGHGEFKFHAFKGILSTGALVKARGLAPQMVHGLDTGGASKTIKMALGATVAGTVRDAKGKPLQGVTIEVVPTDLNSETFVGWFEIGTDKEGNFSLPNVTPDREYAVLARMDGLAHANLATARHIVQVGKNESVTSSIPLVAIPATTVAGKVVLSDGKPIPKGTRIMLGRDGTWDTQQPDIKPDGAFAVRGVPIGEKVGLNVYIPGYQNANEKRNEFVASDKAQAPVLISLVPAKPRPASMAAEILDAPQPDAADIDLDAVVIKLSTIGAKIGDKIQWWDEKGALLTAPPRMFSYMDQIFDSPTSPIALCFTLQNRHAGMASYALRSEDGSVSFRSDNPVPYSSASFLMPMTYFIQPNKFGTGDFKVGVALGDWKAVGSAKVTDANQLKSAEIILSASPEFAFMTTAGKPGVVNLTPEGKPLDLVARRIVAVDRAGNETPLNTTGNMSEDVAVIQVATALQRAKIDPKDIVEFRLQTRSFEWTQFSGLPSKPKS